MYCAILSIIARFFLCFFFKHIRRQLYLCCGQIMLSKVPVFFWNTLYYNAMLTLQAGDVVQRCSNNETECVYCLHGASAIVWSLAKESSYPRGEAPPTCCYRLKPAPPGDWWGRKWFDRLAQWHWHMLSWRIDDRSLCQRNNNSSN